LTAETKIRAAGHAGSLAGGLLRICISLLVQAILTLWGPQRVVERNHIAAGVILLALTLAFLAAKYVRAPGRRRLGGTGWIGLAIILGAEVLLGLRMPSVMRFFTPIVWTGYLFLIDALIESLGGESRLRSPGKFLALAFWSVPLWLIFEAYNLRLTNWTYVGIPSSPGAADLGYVWSFATIWPAIYGTAEFLRALGLFREQKAPGRASNGSIRAAACFLGLVFVLLPVLVPAPVGPYLFGFVWLGFIPLLDPLNHQWNGRSLLRDWEAGNRSTLLSFLAAGWVCGILWEFWNYWAGAKWLYTFPILQDWKIFEMPLPGYVGFLPFAVECFVMYEFLRTVRNRITGLPRRWSRQEVSVEAEPGVRN